METGEIMETTITLPAELKTRVEQEAAACGLSVSEFVRLSLERAVEKHSTADPLFSDTAIFDDDGPTDTAANHDDYLYGDAS